MRFDGRVTSSVPYLAHICCFRCHIVTCERWSVLSFFFLVSYANTSAVYLHGVRILSSLILPRKIPARFQVSSETLCLSVIPDSARKKSQQGFCFVTLPERKRTKEFDRN